jgi:mono/diheme cytochrome c family protein
MKHRLLVTVFLLALQAHGQTLPAAADPQLLGETSRPLLARDSPEAGIVRGSLVFVHYCVTCHGVNADGRGRAARLYNPPPANLRASDKSAAYMRLIVRTGGKAMARSEFMPAWGDELTDEQIADVVTYLQSINPSPR